MEIKFFFNKASSTLTYIVWDKKSCDAVVIDPVLDYDLPSSYFSEKPVIEIDNFLHEQGLNLSLILETHAHADHLSGAFFLKQRFGQAKIAIGKNITLVQKIFKEIYNLGDDFPTDGSQFDKLLSDQEEITAGSLRIKVISTPGHTPACSSYLIGNGVFRNAVFTGDVLFMPDSGVARCDFPGGSAEDIFYSITGKLYKLPENTRLFTCHDYQPGGRDLQFETTIGKSKNENIHLNIHTEKEDFVRFRTERDRKLSPPKLLFPSLFVNISAGRIPQPESNGVSYLKIPIKPVKKE